MTSRTFGAKELEFVYAIVERVSHEFYVRGVQEHAAPKSLNPKDFQLSRARKLEIKTFLNKALNSR